MNSKKRAAKSPKSPRELDAAKKNYVESIGKSLGIIATIVGIIGGAYAIYERWTRPLLELELLIPYTGWEVSVKNAGASIAKQVRLGVVVGATSACQPPMLEVL